MQKSYFEWLGYAYPAVRKVSWAVPNGIKCGKSQAVKAKAEGLTAGALDITIAVPNESYHGLFIEMKIHPNTPTPEQTDMIKNLRTNNYKAEVCYNIDDAMFITKKYLEDR